MTKRDQIIDRSGDKKYFTLIPNLIDDMDLSPYARALYMHIKRVTGESGSCWEGVRTMAQRCRMSPDAVIAAKRELEHAGLITIARRQNRQSDVITITDVWMANSQHFSRPQNTSEVFDMSNGRITNKKNHIIKSVKTRAKKSIVPASAGAPDGAGETDSHTLNVAGGVGGDSPPQERAAPAGAQTPPGYYAALMREDAEGERWRWLRHEMRPLAQAFLAAAGERYYPHDESLRKLWRREIARWIAAGVDGRILSDTVSQMRRQGLAITGPQSVTGMAINYLEQRRAAQDEYPLFIAVDAEHGASNDATTI